MFEVICDGCGESWFTDNEDDAVLSLCVMCIEYGFDHAEERGYSLADGCSCEDYPCCGH